MNMAQRKAERCINPPEEGSLGSQQRHTREVLRGDEAANLAAVPISGRQNSRIPVRDALQT